MPRRGSLATHRRSARAIRLRYRVVSWASAPIGSFPRPIGSLCFLLRGGFGQARSPSNRSAQGTSDA